MKSPGWARCWAKRMRASRARFGCVGCVTNGAARDLPGIEGMGYQVFSGSVAVSHAYAHVVDFGDPVEIGRLARFEWRPFARRSAWRAHDSAGRAGRVAALAKQVLREDRELFELTEQKDFSAAMLKVKLAEVMKQNL